MSNVDIVNFDATVHLTPTIIIDVVRQTETVSVVRINLEYDCTTILVATLEAEV